MLISGCSFELLFDSTGSSLHNFTTHRPIPTWSVDQSFFLFFFPLFVSFSPSEFRHLAVFIHFEFCFPHTGQFSNMIVSGVFGLFWTEIARKSTLLGFSERVVSIKLRNGESGEGFERKTNTVVWIVVTNLPLHSNRLLP